MFSMNMNVPFVKERSEGIVCSSKNRNSRYLLLSFSLAALSSMSGVAFADETGYTTNDELRSVESSLNNRIDRASTTLDNKISQVASDVARVDSKVDASERRLQENIDGNKADIEQKVVDSETRLQKNIDDNVNQLNGRIDTVSDRASDLENGRSGMVQVNTSARGPVPGPKASGANSMAAGSAAEASGNDSTALGNNAKATANNSIALGDSSVADRANSLSVGSRGHERQITNVADATQGTDAVNLRQMNEGLRVTEENARHYTDQRFNRLHKKIEDLDDDLSAGIAGAMAMAALPPPYQAGGTSTGIGAATYRGQSALAFGLSSISKDGKWSTRLSGNMNTAGDAGAAVGVGYNW